MKKREKNGFSVTILIDFDSLDRRISHSMCVAIQEVQNVNIIDFFKFSFKCSKSTIYIALELLSTSMGSDCESR